MQVLVQEESRDDLQWAMELGYLNGQAALVSPVADCTDQSHQLMIFTGLNAGASLPLSDGCYEMGRSFECDIVLKDPGIEPVHLTLICSVDAIAVRPEQGAVYLDGDRIFAETVLPDPPAVVTIAGIHCGLAIEGTGWSPLELPRIREDSAAYTEKDRNAKMSDRLDPTPRPAAGVITRVFHTVADHLRRASLASKIVPLAFLLFSIVSALFFFRVKAPDEAALIAEIETQFRQRRLPTPAAQFDAEGFLEVTAYVSTGSDKEEIAAFLKTLPVAVRPHLHVDDQVAWGLQDYVSKMAFPVDAAYQGNGRVTVNGFAENGEDAAVIKSLLKSNVIGIRAVELHLLPMEQVRTDAASVLKDAGLINHIVLHPQGGHLLAKGSLNLAQRARWQGAKKVLLERLDGQVNIVDEFEKELIGTVPGKIEIPIAGVTMKPHPFITLQDGKVYFKGASLKNGAILKDIGLERIIVQIDGQDYYYNF